MGRRKWLTVIATALGSGLLVGTAWADSGLPMLFLMWPAFGVLFIPIVLVEGYFGVRQLGSGWGRSLVASLLANLLSTVVGVPLTWGILVLAQMGVGGGRAWGLSSPGARVLAVTVQAPWLIPYEEDLYWMVPIAAIVLLIPFFFMSVAIEGLVFAGWMKVDRKAGARWAWTANLATYASMALCAIAYGVWAYISHK